MKLLGHALNMDWAQIVSSIVAVIIIITAPVGWVINMVLKIDRRTTVLETKHKNDSKVLDSISKKVSDVADSVQVIKVAIAKIETVLEARAEDSNMPQRP